jgi:hypothetical protein
MQGWATNRRPWGELNTLERKTNRLASGMAAREGEDPRAGLQRSRQPGPAGVTPKLLSRKHTDNGGHVQRL